MNLTELLRLKAMSIIENPTALKPHIVNILADTTLMKADILHLIKTSLEESEDVLLTINVGNGKGYMLMLHSTKTRSSKNSKTM